jgi:hypothetical protein
VPAKAAVAAVDDDRQSSDPTAGPWPQAGTATLVRTVAGNLLAMLAIC